MTTKNCRVTVERTAYAVASLILFATASHAAEFPRAYEATVENASGGTSHMWSDGQGHMRTETTVRGNSYASITDFNKKMTYSINDQAKTITAMALVGKPGEDPTMNWQSIGTKVIDGHPCKGKKATKDGNTFELWTGDDTDCTVLMTNNGQVVHKLKSWSATKPNPSMFNLPAGYKTVDMNALMSKFQAHK